MSYCLRRLAAPIAAMVAILALGMATPARANLQIWVSSVNNPPLVGDMVASGTTTASFSGTIGDVIVNLAAQTNSPGGGGTAQVLGSDTSITNSSANTVTIFFTIGSTGFTNPVTPPNIVMLSHIGGSVPLPIGGDPANLLTYQSYVDSANGQNSLGALTTGAQTPDVRGTIMQSFNSDAPNLTITSLAGPYSITERFSLTLSANSEINFASSTTLTNLPLTPIPEPSTLAIAGIGGLGLIGYGLRRRKARGA